MADYCTTFTHFFAAEQFWTIAAENNEDVNQVPKLGEPPDDSDTHEGNQMIILVVATYLDF